MGKERRLGKVGSLRRWLEGSNGHDPLGMHRAGAMVPEGAAERINHLLRSWCSSGDDGGRRRGEIGGAQHSFWVLWIIRDSEGLLGGGDESDEKACRLRPAGIF